MQTMTKVLLFVVASAFIMTLIWGIIGRYDLVAIVVIGNLPATAFLIYRLRNDL